MSDSNGAKNQRAYALVSLRDMVLKGQFSPGKRIEEVDLGRQLGVSRRVLLAVIHDLLEEGLLEIASAGGYTARNFTIQDIRDTIRARASLEGLAVALAAQRLEDDAELAAARQINAELAREVATRSSQPPPPDELSRFGALNGAFHREIVRLAQSPMLSWCIQRIQTLAFASPSTVVIPAGGDGGRRAVEQHEGILKALQARDAALAERLTREHASAPIAAIESALNSHAQMNRNIPVAMTAGKSAKPAPARKREPVVAKKSKAGSASTSERILDAAAELFCEKGFHAATTRELAARLRIQQASLYHHVRNKEELLYRICRLVADSFVSGVPAAAGLAPAGWPRIDAWIDTHLSLMNQHPQRSLVAVTAVRALARPHFSEIADAGREYARRLEAEVKAAQAHGALRKDIDAKYIRLALMNVLNWTPRWFKTGGVLSCDELSAIYRSVFREGIVSPALTRVPTIRPIAARSKRHGKPDAHRGTLGKFIRAAAELFAKRGYESTSTRNLATLLGLERATLYYHVEGKEDLLYAICKSSIELLNREVEEAIEGVEDPLEQLQVWIQAHVVSLLRNQTQHATSLAEARALSPDRLAEIVTMRKAYQSRIRALLAAGQKAGCVRADIAPKYLGQMLEGLLDGTVLWFQRRGELSPSELALGLCNVFLTGAKRRAR